jgi:MFS transporter, CP family, cyanate transporter
MLSAIALLWLAGVAVREPILAVPPVISILRSELQMSATEIGILSGLPMILTAAAAIPGSLAISKFGALRTLIGAFILGGIGAALRGFIPNVAALFASTVVMSIGIAVAQPALPVIVRQWLSSRIGFGTATYSNGMVVGCFLPMLFAPMLALFAPATGWRVLLAGSSLLLFVVAGLLGAMAPRAPDQSALQEEASLARSRPLDRRLLWRLGLIFGSNNCVYFGTNAFLPLYLIEIGRQDLVPVALGIYNLGQIPSSLLLMVFASRVERRVWPYALTGMLLISSIAAICLAADTWILVAIGMLGFASGFSLVLGLALPPLLCAPSEVGRMSAAMFTISYTFAMIISVACGFASDLTGDTRSALILLGISVLPLVLLPPTIQFHRS